MNDKHLTWILLIPAFFAFLVILLLVQAFLWGGVRGLGIVGVLLTFAVCAAVIALPVMNYLRTRQEP